MQSRNSTEPAEAPQTIAEKVLVIIPTYNEAENIPRLIPAVLRQAPNINILVVDDGSPDGTGKLVKDMMTTNPQVSILERAGKQGLGTAYVAGFKYAIQNGFDFVFEMDADFSHDPNDLPRFLEKIKDYDLVIGSRYINGVRVLNWPMNRLLLSYSANVYTQIITGLPVRDATGGFKCYRVSALKTIDLDKIKSNGYAFQIEISFKVWKKGYRLVEIPIIFLDRRSGVSKMSRSIVYEAVFMLWKLRIRSILNRL
ncbi:MAG: polyprenol monophosphomannose synthase [Bacteroidetes bacterium]|nr:polyprenol monophosphomannose synthase [Bacteroidota bacterium]MCW5895351.1 polyprenol monophosphomannose synthase [Bacteroidota bacterium]